MREGQGSRSLAAKTALSRWFSRPWEKRGPRSPPFLPFYTPWPASTQTPFNNCAGQEGGLFRREGTVRGQRGSSSDLEPPQFTQSGFQLAF